ncbi:MAG TPA: MoaD/ThiS family protein [Bacteroidota bacterium]|nr:MoaD/ThiS family protein [Bacteroidota bacterium]
MRVLVFGGVREIVGSDSVEVELAGGATSEDVLNALAAAHPALGRWRPFLRVAVNRQYAPEPTRLSPGDEIAVIPPVSGG